MPSKGYHNLEELKAILNELFSKEALAVLSHAELCQLESYLSDLQYPIEVQRQKEAHNEFAEIVAIFKKYDYGSSPDSKS